MRVVTGQEMASLDARSIAAGLPAAALMEAAGAAAAQVAMALCGGIAGKRVHVLCGSGHNGGDGFVLARRLHNAGARVRVDLVGEPDKLAGETAQFYKVLAEMGCQPAEVRQVNERFRFSLAMCDLIVDALLGTGIKGAPRGLFADVIAAANSAGPPVLAVDIPAGVDADSGRVPGAAIRAAQTVTFGLPKLGLLLYPGAECAGQVTVADIGFPASHLAWRGEGWPLRHQLTAELVTSWRARRRKNTHKGDYGRVLVVAGSRGMLGAGALATQAALRGGAGLVTWAGPQALWPVMAAKVTEATTLGLPESEPGYLGEAAAAAIGERLGNGDVLAIGPGLGRCEATLACVRQVCRQARAPVVIDADGLYALNGLDAAALGRATGEAPGWVLTPHPGEAAALLGRPLAQLENDRPAAVTELAARFNCVAVLKGVPTLVAAPAGGLMYINSSGNPGMATGGMGDVLTGLVAALLGQGLAALPAAAAAVYLHGLAGDMAARNGQDGLIAGDVVNALPAALAACWEQERRTAS